jgi:glycoside/pentoside/hexuronide transporter
MRYNVKKKEKQVAVPGDANYIAPEDRVPLKEKICYGIGGLMDGGGVALMSCILVKYMTTMGIPMKIATTIFMIAKLWDAVTDPVMGFISDNTRGRWGRRKPYMFAGGISIIVSIFLLFMPVKDWGVSTNGFIAYMLIMYLLWNTCSTLSQVPYCSMSSDISPSFRERNNANTVKLIFTAAASGLAYVLPLLFIESLISADGWLFMPHINTTEFWLSISIIFGTLFGGGLIICSIFVKERIKPTTAVEKFNAKQFVKSYTKPYKNRSYRWHIVMYVSAFACMDMISALAVFYATDVWHGEKLFGMDISSMFIIAPLMVAAVVMFPLARKMMDKKSKQFAFRMGLPFYIFGGIMFAIMEPSWTPPILIPIVALIMGLGFGGAQMMPWIIFPDTVDVGEMATGDRSTGTYSGMMTLARKVGGALAVGLVGWILGWCGYKENDTGDTTVYIQQSDTALLAIRLVMGITVAILIAIALYASFKYKVDNKKLARIRYFIDARKKGVELSDEETAERDALVAELYGKVDEKDVVVPQVLDDEGNVVEVSDEKIDEEFGSAFGTVENDESENDKN